MDKETNDPFVFINQLPDDESQHTKAFQALGFSQEELCVPLTDVISKIQLHTEGKTSPAITEQRYLHYSNFSFNINL